MTQSCPGQKPNLRMPGRVGRGDHRIHVLVQVREDGVGTQVVPETTAAELLDVDTGKGRPGDGTCARLRKEERERNWETQQNHQAALGFT